MNNKIGYFILTASLICVLALTMHAPFILGDKNKFLENFVNHELLNFLGVIVAITLASAANIHVELRRLEGEYKYPNLFSNTRREVKSGAYALIWLLLIAFVICIIKPIIGTTDRSSSFMNGIALIIVVWNSLILLSLTQLVFKVGPSTDSKSE